MAGAVTYFGDVLTVGNTKIVQNLFSKGGYSIFNGNLNPEVTATTSIGASAGTIYSSNSNTTTLNVTSLYGPESLRTFAGNVFVSNSIASQKVLAITSANTITLNTAAIFGINGKVGVNCVPTTTGPTLNISGNVYASTNLSATNVFATTSANVAVMNTSYINGFVGINCDGGGASLNVTGNVYVSNSMAATNVISSRINLDTLNTSAFVSLIGINCNRGGATLNVAGNSWISNPIQSTLGFYTNVTTTTTNCSSIFAASAGSVGIYQVPVAGGANVQINGNVFASNALVSVTIIAPTANTSTTNLNRIFKQSVGIGKAAPTSSLDVVGNIYSSNSISTANIFCTNSNASVANVTRIMGTSEVLGINFTPVAGGPTLQFGSGNLYASNALSATTISTDVIQTYNEDITRRSPYLISDTSNAPYIQNWISATCNANQDVGWTVSKPTFSNAVGLPVAEAFCGGVYMPDGNVLFTPRDGKIGIYNPKVNEVSVLTVAGLSNAFRGGVLAPNGNVIFVPMVHSNIGVYNPVAKTFSNVDTYVRGAFIFQGGCLVPSGNVIFFPRNSSNVGIFNPTNMTYSNSLTKIGSVTGSYGGGCLLPNGNVVMCPRISANSIQYNPVTQLYTNCGPFDSESESAVLAADGNVVFVPTTGNAIVYNPSFLGNPLASGAYSNIISPERFFGGALLPTGNVVFSPVNTAYTLNIGMVDPVAMTYSNCSPCGGSFSGATLIPSGQVIFAPNGSGNVGVLNTLHPVSREFCMSPYFNKL